MNKLLLPSLALVTVACVSAHRQIASTSTPSTTTTSNAPTAPERPLTVRDDPAIVRKALLAALDAHIDEIATKSRYDARAMLDRVMPIPYLGVDSEPKDGGLSLTAVYADMGAERAGLKKGDVVRSFGGVATDTKAALARAVRSRRVGEPIEVRFERDGKPMNVTATLGPRPEEDEDDSEQFPDLVVPPGPLPKPLTFDFERDASGASPSGLRAYLGGHGRAGTWVVQRDGGNASLLQSDDDRTGTRFAMVIANGFETHDAKAAVRFRYRGGRTDRAAGVVLRFRDPGNYLVARANAAEGDLRIFRVVNGDRRTLPGAMVKGATDDDAWHTLEFRAHGAELEAVLDGNVRAVAQDTFLREGGAGLWIKADSRTEFDDLALEALQ